MFDASPITFFLHIKQESLYDFLCCGGYNSTNFSALLAQHDSCCFFIPFLSWFPSFSLQLASCYICEYMSSLNFQFWGILGIGYIQNCMFHNSIILRSQEEHIFWVPYHIRLIRITIQKYYKNVVLIIIIYNAITV